MNNPLHKDAKIGVVGAGTMGRGIAQIAATARHDVFLYDTYTNALENARKHLGNILQRQVEKERMSNEQIQQIMSRIQFVEDTTRFADVGLAIEAVVEDLKTKQDVFKRLEGIVPAESYLATNTSSLSIASISAALKKPRRFLGAHFFNPAPVMPLVEIIPGIQTDKQVTDHVYEFMESWNKSPVVARDTPGFIVNRVARPFYGEALRIYEEGIADIPTIDWAMTELGGFKMGPFELMDFIGNDINYKVTRTVFEEFFYDPRFKPSFTQKRMVEARLYGRKTGRGFYNYEDSSKNNDPNRDEKLGEQILNRILVMLINEAADAVYMQVATVEDVDKAMKKGVRYPRGLLEWADDVGLQWVLKEIRQLQETYGEDRYRPNPLLQKLANNNNTFY